MADVAAIPHRPVLARARRQVPVDAVGGFKGAAQQPNESSKKKKTFTHVFFFLGTFTHVFLVPFGSFTWGVPVASEHSHGVFPFSQAGWEGGLRGVAPVADHLHFDTWGRCVLVKGHVD